MLSPASGQPASGCAVRVEKTGCVDHCFAAYNKYFLLSVLPLAFGADIDDQIVSGYIYLLVSATGAEECSSGSEVITLSAKVL